MGIDTIQTCESHFTVNTLTSVCISTNDAPRAQFIQNTGVNSL